MELEDFWQEFGLDELSRRLGQLFPGTGLSLEKLMGRLLKGDLPGMITEIWSATKNNVIESAEGIKSLFVWVLILGLVSAMMVHFSDMFSRYQVGEICFYFVYLLQAAILVRSFSAMMDTASRAMDSIVLFVKLMMPTYLLAVGITTGSLTAGASYQLVVFLIYGVQELLKGFLLPMVTGYMLMTVLEGIHAQERMGFLISLLKKVVNWCLKGALGAVTGFSLLQSTLTPALDNITSSALERLVAAIPGIGNGAESLMKLSVNCALVIKNSVGVLLLVLLLMMCLAPLFEILATALVLKAAAAFMAIVSDKRMTEAVDRVGEAGILLTKIVGSAALLFLVAIAISAASVHP